MTENIVIVVDLETTGLDYANEKIIEFAGLKLVDGEIVDEFETLINPEQHIRHSSMNIHGITEEMVADAPKTADIFPKILEFMGDYPLVAHNSIFDHNFLNQTSKNLYDKPIKNRHIDTQHLFRDVCPEEKSHGLLALMNRFGIEEQGTKHRAMADAKGLALAYPKLEDLYFQKNAWQVSQIDNVEYLLERYVRIQNAIQTMQSELGDIKSVFKVYFEQGGESISASTGEVLCYNARKSYTYDFMAIKDTLEELGSLQKVIKVNGGLLDRMIYSSSIDEDARAKIRSARMQVTQNKNVNIQKPDSKRH